MPKVYSYELKLSVVKFYNSEIWSIENALEIFGVSQSSIYGWIALYKNNQLCNTSNVRNNYERKINDEAEKYIAKYVIKKVYFT